MAVELLAASGLCLVLASTPLATPILIQAKEFTLAWTHSIEKTRWEEDYTVVSDKEPILIAGTARIKGSGSGMEPPPSAILRNGWYEYQPDPKPKTPLRLTRSGFTPDYDLCIKNQCKPMEYYLPTDGGITLLFPCFNTK